MVDENAATALEEYVKSRNGKRVIRKILIANNGLAAVRFIRRLREWSYTHLKNDRALHFISMTTPEDVGANAEYFRLADEFVMVPGGSNKNNFAKVDLIVDVAKRTGADAVWPGWGHASENPNLPASLEAAGITFLGPPAGAMDAVGDKICANLLAQSVGVNVIPWSGSGLKSEGVQLSKELIAAATLSDVEAAVASAERVGFPLMIKASEGGGGKGIRMVKNMDELRVGFDQVQKEVVGSPIFIQKLGVNARHLEVQVVADEYGEAITLYGRDCSVQRRHQKLFEEGPVTIAPRDLCIELEQGAARLAKFVGYRSAGTVEYLYSVDSGEYSFLEVNPRLQVEHPVTEGITGVCIPAIQLNVAMGIPLHCIPDIREFYGEDPAATSKIDFASAKGKAPACHTIAARITAENIEDGFKPTSGAIHEMFYRPIKGISASFSVSGSGGVHQFADSQFGHLFSHAATREEAARNLMVALKEMSIRGEISNNLRALEYIVQSDEFLSDKHHTGWLDGLIASKTEFVGHVPELLAVVCGSVVTARQLFLSNRDEVMSCLERGVVPDKTLTNFSHHTFDLIYRDVKYTANVAVAGDMSDTSCAVNVEINGSSLQAQVINMFDQGLKVLLNRQAHVVYAERVATGMKVVVDGRICFFPDDADPTALQTSSAGKLVSFLVEDGDVVQPGQPYAEIEVMKTVMPLLAMNGPGKVSLKKTPGCPLEAGDILAKLQLADGAQVKQAEPFKGQFPPALLDTDIGSVSGALQSTLEDLSRAMAGYGCLSDLVSRMLMLSSNVQLVREEAAEAQAQCQGLPPALEAALAAAATAGEGLENAAVVELVSQVDKALHAAVPNPFDDVYAPVRHFVARFKRGLPGLQVDIITRLLKDYLFTEQHFDEAATYQDAILEMREIHKTELRRVADAALSHAHLETRNKVVLGLMEHIGRTGRAHEYIDILARLSDLGGVAYLEVAQKTKELLFGVDQAQRAADQKSRRTGNSAPSVLGLDVDKPAYKTQGLGALPDFPGGMGSPKASTASIMSLDSGSIDEDDVLEAMRAIDLSRDMQAMLASAASVYEDIPLVNVSAIFNYQDRKVQAAAIKDYFETFGVLNAIQCSNQTVKMQYGNGATVFVLRSLEEVPPILNNAQSQGVLSRIGFMVPAPPPGTDPFGTISSLMDELREDLCAGDLLKVSFTVLDQNRAPRHFTFCKRLGFMEDEKFRDIEPALALQMELDRLCQFHVDSLAQTPPPASEIRQGMPDYRIHVFHAKEKSAQSASEQKRTKAEQDQRIFARTVVYNPTLFLVSSPDSPATPGASKKGLSSPGPTPASPSGRMRRQSSFSKLSSEEVSDECCIEESNVLIDLMRNLELAVGQKRTAWNYMFCHLVSKGNSSAVTIDQAENTVRLFTHQFLHELARLKVSWVEVKVGMGRVVAYNPTGNRFKVERYMDDDISGEAEHPYPALNSTQRKQMVAQKASSTYIYDFLDIFADLVQSKDPVPDSDSKDPPFKASELVLNVEGNLELTNRPTGTNDAGMVAFQIWMRTPEFPAGRQIILVGSDLAHQSGSFSPREDIVYSKGVELARKQGLPFIYISSNSGARIGLNEDVKKRLRVQWVNDADPSKGFKYLYLDPEDYRAVADTVHAVRVAEEGGEERYRIVDVYGGYGVECLKGSGMIANATSAAYDETFTLSYITGRSVGIGAYISRLSQRIIQHTDAPIILTGASALNKVLGRQVYSSNAQIGGPKVMYHNGISHLVVHNDVQGCEAILNWLAFVPGFKSGPLPISPCSDPVGRLVEWSPGSGPYDPRNLLAGGMMNGEYKRGFFDEGSWTETLGEWGKTVVTGRARLGGLPMGVVAVETRTMERVVPADPGFAGSTVQVIQQAGQVWFPDSAFKTANSINDYNREGLPLMIFANWRGFAGGQRDMFDEVLKFGSYIVDALRNYRQPVFVYLPAAGELRGGAWVVIDPTINPEMMRMYTSEDAKGNVLEPEGIVEIKFRKPDLLKAMKRLDPEYANLSGPQAIAREKQLLPIYQQIATAYAALHDTPGVMKHKGVISDIVPWSQSRSYFYDALRTRLTEVELDRHIRKANPSLSMDERSQILDKELRAAVQSLATADARDLYNQVEARDDVKEVVDRLERQHMKELISGMDAQKVVEALMANHSAADLKAMLGVELPASNGNGATPASPKGRSGLSSNSFSAKGQ